MAQDEYQVRLDVFEGPLDLLLYLIRRDEVDIYNIPIERITTQYMETLSLMRMLDLNIAGEFLVMAATLMMIKSRMLLPAEERGDVPDEDDEDDPRWELVRQLVEYKQFKEAAEYLLEREVLQENAFLHGGGGVMLEPEDPGLPLQDVSLFDLIASFQAVLDRAAEEELGEIFAERFTVAEKIEAILARARCGEAVRFTEFFESMHSRQELVCTFLALLELIRLRQVDVQQKRRFGEILICAAEPEAAAATAGTEG